MSGCYAGYAGIGMMLSGKEMEGFTKKYCKVNRENLEEQYALHDQEPPCWDDLDEYDISELQEVMSEDIDYTILRAEFAEGFSFHPYWINNNPNYEYVDTGLDTSQETVFLFLAEKNNNGVRAIFNDRRYNSYKEIVDEFKEKYEKYLPENFDWDAHIGQYSYACYA